MFASEWENIMLGSLAVPMDKIYRNLSHGRVTFEVSLTIYSCFKLLDHSDFCCAYMQISCFPMLIMK